MSPCSIALRRAVPLSRQSVIPLVRAELVVSAAASERGALRFETAVPGGGSLSVPVRLHVRYPAFGGHSFDVRVEAVRSTPLYPHFSGTLEVRDAHDPATPDRAAHAELVLAGEYRVPLGLVGRVVDATAAGGIAEATLARFLDRIVTDVLVKVASESNAAYRAARRQE